MDIEMSTALTRGNRVRAKSQFVEDRSSPERDFYFFAYRIVIANEGDETVQLLSRHWIITDGNGETQEVEGPGVIGQQPTLEPGQHFAYTSACPLPTPVGAMHGTYQMITDSGETFDAKVPAFSLALPNILN